MNFERELSALLRDVGRMVTELAYNQLERDQPEQLPHDVVHEAGAYRRLNAKTPNREVATLFGKITLWRHGYRYVQRDVAEPTIFPLEVQLGLVAGATPALASEAARRMAETGATQQTVLDRLKEQHGVTWGVKKLRAVTENVAQAMERFRREHQAKQVVAWLRQAQKSKGKHRPVLAVGRDGITLQTQPHSFFEVATTATLTVSDRRGQRLGTVYLAYAPELGQQTMTDELTALLDEVLRQWDGPLPRLAYLTDAGDSETKYYRQVLKKLRHPRTGKRLHWQWIVDFYHAAQRLTTMAEALFGAGREASAWAARMRKLLKKSNGPFRVLHAAAAMQGRVSMSAARRKLFRQAYHYLRTRTKHLQYAAFRRQGLPIGSGVTEAACKTVFTQRLKLSGMRWSGPGAQTILNLRVLLLSGLWDQVYSATVNSYDDTTIQTPARFTPRSLKNAA
ncbi:MAG: transposase [Acidobacteria bacterium]|nr:transposase [Acidobacteriota bacterium]